MVSLQFPNMFSSTRTNLVENKQANMSNLKLLLLSERWSLFGDPFYGTSFRRAIFEQNNSILQNLLIDEIFTVIKLFMPQIQCPRKNITITSDGVDLYANITCINRIDGTSDLYTLNLTNKEQ